MDLGSAIALAGVSVPLGGVAITAIVTYRKPRETSVSARCMEHSGMVAELKSINDKLDTLTSLVESLIRGTKR